MRNLCKLVLFVNCAYHAGIWCCIIGILKIWWLREQLILAQKLVFLKIISGLNQLLSEKMVNNYIAWSLELWNCGTRCCGSVAATMNFKFKYQGLRSNFWIEMTKCWTSYGGGELARATAIGMNKFNVAVKRFSQIVTRQENSISSSKLQLCG